MNMHVKQLIADPFLMIPAEVMSDKGRKAKREKKKPRNWRPTWNSCRH